MERPKSPYQEVTTPDNTEIHGHLKDRTWGGLQTLRGRHHLISAAAAIDFDPEGEFAWVRDALGPFCQTIIRTSGSIEGKHRDSTVQAIQGQKAPPTGLVGTTPPPMPASAARVPV